MKEVLSNSSFEIRDGDYLVNTNEEMGILKGSTVEFWPSKIVPENLFSKYGFKSAQATVKDVVAMGKC
jgi:hypothetical protein